MQITSITTCLEPVGKLFALKWLVFVELNRISLPFESSSSIVVELSVEALGSLDESPLEFFAIDLAAKLKMSISFIIYQLIGVVSSIYLSR